MLFILAQVVSISLVVLIYLWQHFNYSTLSNEIQEMKQTKRKILLEIERIRLESSKYSSVHRIESLFAEYSPETGNIWTSPSPNQKVAQKIVILKIPPVIEVEEPSTSKVIEYK